MNSNSEQHSTCLQSQLLDLQSELSRMGMEKASIQSQLLEQKRQSEEYARQLRSLQVHDYKPFSPGSNHSMLHRISKVILPYVVPHASCGTLSYCN